MACWIFGRAMFMTVMSMALRSWSARDGISELRGQIEELTARPAEQEAAVSRLEITSE